MELADLERKYRYAANITKTAKQNGYAPKDVPCSVCGKNITLEEVENQQVEYVKRKGSSNGEFFHTKCYKDAWNK